MRRTEPRGHTSPLHADATLPAREADGKSGAPPESRTIAMTAGELAADLRNELGPPMTTISKFHQPHRQER
ncbi:MAG: hypothetical protein ACRD68_06970 [Pyrinomonadaceae bacterium]